MNERKSLYRMATPEELKRAVASLPPDFAAGFNAQGMVIERRSADRVESANAPKVKTAKPPKGARKAKR